jgi:hypothetical protein
MKPPTPRLAAVEAAEQAQNLRVVGGGSSPAPKKEAAGEGENRGIAWDKTVDGGDSDSPVAERGHREKEEKN